MTRSVVLHVGAVPQAPRRIRHSFDRNAAALRPLGVDYTPYRPDGFARRITQASTTGGTILVAGNMLGRPFGPTGLFPDAAQELGAVAAAVREQDPGVILTICPPADFLEAEYHRVLAGGNWAEFGTWLASVDLADLSWRPAHAAVIAAFGAENVRVVTLDPASDSGTVALRALLRAAGLPVDALGDPLREPVRDLDGEAANLSGKGLRLALAAAPHLPGHRERTAFARFLLRHFCDADYPPLALLDDSQRREFDERYAAEFRELVATGRATP